MTDPAAGAVVIGCSMGGIKALTALFADLSPLIQRPVLVVCHIRQDDISGLCDLESEERLDESGRESRVLQFLQCRVDEVS